MLYTYPSNNYSANYKKVSKSHETATKWAVAVALIGFTIMVYMIVTH